MVMHLIGEEWNHHLRLPVGVGPIPLQVCSFGGRTRLVAVGVRQYAVCCGDPEEPLSDVRGVDGASRDIERPAGVTDSFQISGESVEPIAPKRSRNLLSHNERGPAGVGELIKVGP